MVPWRLLSRGGLLPLPARPRLQLPGELKDDIHRLRKHQSSDAEGKSQGTEAVVQHPVPGVIGKERIGKDRADRPQGAEDSQKGQ